MKNISLFKVTAMVITAALASSLVNAEDKVTETIEKSQPEMVKVEQELSFPGLIAKVDSDQNGMLSLEELTATQNKVLQAEFTNIDANQDQQIDEAEFNSFIAEIKDKATNIAKSDD
jgi:Ca2+-binding EF-hand superfamily protein